MCTPSTVVCGHPPSGRRVALMAAYSMSSASTPAVKQASSPRVRRPSGSSPAARQSAAGHLLLKAPPARSRRVQGRTGNPSKGPAKRYDKLLANFMGFVFMGFVKLAAIAIWLR